MPIFGILPAIIGFIGGIGTFLTSGTLLAKIAFAGLSMAARYAMQKFLGPQTPPAQASKLETEYGEKLPRDIVQGKVGTAGHHIYRNAYGKGNHIVQDVYVLSHWNIAGVTRVRFNGEWWTLGGPVDAERGQRIADIDAEIWIKVYTGTMDQVADPGLIARSNPLGRWTENHRGAGVAYAVVTSVLSREHLTGPWEAFFEVEGVTYDWRKDDSRGGVGNHRYDDPTTWEPTTNPFLIAYCATRGFWRGEEKIVGKGRSSSSLPLSRWTLAANIADELVGGKKRYQAACILRAGEGVTHDGNLQPLLEAAAASWIEEVGEEYPIAGANQTPVTSFTDDDLVIGEPFRFSEKRTRSELVNTVAGTFVDPAAFYQAMPLATRVDDIARATDGERLAVPLSFTVVTEAACVDRLADIALRASRYQANGELCLRHKYLALKPGQWVTWISARFGWTKTFQVQSKRLGSLGPKGARNVYVSVQEVGEGIFDPTAYVTIPPDRPGPGVPDYMSELDNLELVGLTVKDEASGKQYPIIQLSWSEIDDPTVIGVDFRYRPKFQPDAVLLHPTVADDISVTRLVNGILSDTRFEVSHRLVTSPVRVVAWSAWAEVLTPDTPWTDVYPEGFDEKIIEAREDAKQFAGEGAREARERMRQLALYGMEQDGQNVLDKRELTLAMQDELGNKASLSLVESLSGYISEVDGKVTIFGVAMTEIQAALTGYTGSNAIANAFNGISVQIQLLDGELTAISEDLSIVEAEVDDIASSVTVRAQAGASPGQGWSRYIVEVKTGLANWSGSVGLYMDVHTDGTRRLMADAATFVFGDLSGAAPLINPLVYEAGIWRMNVANIGTVTAGILRSADSEFVIGLDNKFFEIWTAGS